MPPKITVRGVTAVSGNALELVIKSDDVEHVQVLPLVFVQPLHLNVEERLRIHSDVGALIDEGGQGRLLSDLVACHSR